MTDREIILREFKYYDREIVEDFLSSIEGGLTKESRLSSNTQKGRIGGELGVGFAKVSAQKGATDVTEEETKTVGYAALFQRLYDLLDNRGMIKRESEITSIKQGAILELSADIELPFFEIAMDVFVQMLPMMQGQNMNPAGIAMINMLSKTETIPIKLSLPIKPDCSIVAILKRENLRGSKQGLVDNYIGLYRVKRVLKENETFDILKLPVKMNQKMADDFLKSLNNTPNNALELLGKKPTYADLQVKYPAIILTPIAIYQ